MFKKVGILGSGIVGRVLADGFLKHGYEVMMGTRDPSKLSEWLKTPIFREQEVDAISEDMGPVFIKGESAKKRIERARERRKKYEADLRKALAAQSSELNPEQKRVPLEKKVGTFAETASFAECIVLSVKGNDAVSALELAGAANLKGKIVIDTTNPIADGAPVNGVLPFYTSLDKSQMEDLQSRFPAVRFVKAFSCIGNAFMVNPSFPEGKPTMFICGNDDKAKQQVSQLLEQFGHDPADMGAVEAARAIEPLCMLWCIPGITRNQWNHAFRLIRS